MNDPDHISESLETIFWVRRVCVEEHCRKRRLVCPGSGGHEPKVLMTENWKKIYSCNTFYIYFGSKYFCLHKGRTSYGTREAFGPQKRTSSAWKHEHHSLLKKYLWVIFALPDPDPATQFNADPDPIPCRKHRLVCPGSGGHELPSGQRAGALQREPAGRRAQAPVSRGWAQHASLPTGGRYHLCRGEG